MRAEIQMCGPITSTNSQKLQTALIFCIMSLINLLIPVINYIICKFYVIPLLLSGYKFDKEITTVRQCAYT